MDTSLRDRRVELIHTTDQHTNLKPGDQGKISFVDATGTVHIKWDNGSTLGLIEQAGDRWKLLD
jgi:Domain of unknown function (DUF4314)